jgi:hypothetical protein
MSAHVAAQEGCPTPTADTLIPKEKARPMGRASIFLKFYSIIILYHVGEGKRAIFSGIFTQHYQQLSQNHLLPSY